MRIGQRRTVLAVTMLLGALALPAALAVQSDDGDDQALLADADYAAGLAALKAGDMAAALTRFEAALKRFPDSANLHNEIGFTQRKLRRMNKAFEHYKRALAIDPRHRGAHEYIGEAYLEVGDVAAAEKHLAELGAICLLPCEEQAGLRRAINEYRTRVGAR